jgi:hypothetical protein
MLDTSSKNKITNQRQNHQPEQNGTTQRGLGDKSGRNQRRGMQSQPARGNYIKNILGRQRT